MLIQVVCFANTEFGQPLGKETSLETTALRDEPLGLCIVVAAPRGWGAGTAFGLVPYLPGCLLNRQHGAGSTAQAARHRQHGTCSRLAGPDRRQSFPGASPAWTKMPDPGTSLLSRPWRMGNINYTETGSSNSKLTLLPL